MRFIFKSIEERSILYLKSKNVNFYVKIEVRMSA